MTHTTEPAIPAPETLSGAEAFIRVLLDEGIDTIFGYPGGNVIAIYDALYHYTDRLHHILTRHEQGAVHAAQGYARATGKTGIVLATSGPGATNLVTGLADAQLDSTPIVCITGQVAEQVLGSDGFQETDIIGISMPVTKWNFQVTKAKDIAPALSKALYIAHTGRPGPVLIDFTANAQKEMCSYLYKKCNFIRSYIPTPHISKASIAEAADLINRAEKPLVLVGQGVQLSHAEPELREFIEKGNLPAGCTLMGLSSLPTGHPLYMGMLGMHGQMALNKKTNECDVLIAVGMRFSSRIIGAAAAYAPQAKVIHLEVDPSEINRSIAADIPVLGNMKRTLPMLTEKLEAHSHREWIESFKTWQDFEYDKVIRKQMQPETGSRITMGEVVKAFGDIDRGEAIVVTDVGQHQMMAARYARMNHPRSFITSGGLGTMGFGLPAAIGAKVGCPDREVVLFVGDGGIQMTIQEFGTILQNRIPVKIILLNNSFLGMVRQWQELFYGKRYSCTELENPDFIRIAQAYGIACRRVTERKDLSAAMQELCDSQEAFFLEVDVEKEGMVFPMIPAGASIDQILYE